MKHFGSIDIEKMEKVSRLRLINSITGVKPANLIGTKSGAGISNLAIISSVVHLGSNPALIGFILRPQGKVPRHTFENILETGTYTINHVAENFIEQAHYTSAKFDRDISEFERCNFTEEYYEAFHAPFVAESELKIGMKFLESVPIALNNTEIIIGKIEHIFVNSKAITKENDIDLDVLQTVGIGGLNTYYSLKKLNKFPYARTQETPKF